MRHGFFDTWLKESIIRGGMGSSNFVHEKMQITFLVGIWASLALWLLLNLLCMRRCGLYLCKILEFAVIFVLKKGSYEKLVAFTKLNVLPVLRLQRFHNSSFLVFYLMVLDIIFPVSLSLAIGVCILQIKLFLHFPEQRF
jgi:hypothetical protein